MIEYTVRVFINGDKEWYLNGSLSREDGPAIEYVSGSKFWYLNNELHRENGPAIETKNGVKYWFLNGNQYSKKKYWKKVKKLQQSQSCKNKIVEIDGKKYRLQEVT